VSTSSRAECPESFTMGFLKDLIYGILCAEEPSPFEKLPPIKAWWQSLVSWIELTVPLTFGVHEVTLYGAVRLKLKMLCRVKVLPPHLIAVNAPTAYMVPPHLTSWRTCSVLPVGASWGVPLAGLGDT